MTGADRHRRAPADVVRAAGGVVWRPHGAGERRIAIIHRPRYDDWTLPKGKLDPGEDDETAALREVAEETGQHGHILRDLGQVAYRSTKRGVTFDKVVRYFEMSVQRPVLFVAGDEVDELRWLAAEEALELLTYDRDAEVMHRYDPSLQA